MSLREPGDLAHNIEELKIMEFAPKKAGFKRYYNGTLKYTSSLSNQVY